MAVSFTKFNLFYKRHLQYAPIYKFISRTPPWFWGVLYLSIIPLFALIYHLKFTNDFYHSTLKYEHNYLAGESFYLNRGLINQIILNFEKLHSGKHDTIIDFNRIYIDKLAIYDNSADENEIVQSFLFQIFKIDSISKIEKFEKFGKMTVRLSKENISNWNENGKTMYLKLAFIEKMNEDLFAKDIFFPNHARYSTVVGEHVNFLECSEQLESQIYNFIQSSNNFSANIEGNFWRMFYLSSITVTTVGFGDIVPLTKRARIAVSIEAILGVTFIGFFLNSIGSKMQLRNFE